LLAVITEQDVINGMISDQSQLKQIVNKA